MNSGVAPGERSGAFTTACICTTLRQATRSVTRFYDDALAPSGLATTQYSLLSQVRTHGPIGITELSERIVMDRSTLSRNIQPLLAQGLLVLKSAADRRRRVISITPRGARAYDRARPLWLEAQRSFEQRFGGTPMRELRTLMRSAIDLFRAD